MKCQSLFSEKYKKHTNLSPAELAREWSKLKPSFLYFSHVKEVSSVTLKGLFSHSESDNVHC